MSRLKPTEYRPSNADAGSEFETTSFQEAVESCRGSALRLLGLREHSVAELQRKLAARKYSRGVRDRVVADLGSAGLLNDLAFARAYCEYRANGGRPVGRRRVFMELRKRGVAADTIEEALAETWDEDDGESELARAVVAAQSKWRLVKGRGDAFKAKGKVYRFLATRGFSSDICRAVLETLEEE
ncbi:MAG: regulatory protein RecX [Lentisphaerae bacterium]|jgi:regulatory protein|nr:regulatory protein RecX [Lentisphaerota bacterium]MBT5604437.1 regulatory protein RecX [Lentisphaerota bacterium]MBT7058194.1 regulatory protein RecX [Lentisphaerota bacterium]MBT7847422.1 regulatory protein RecX [Lentisphaerota bacterium]